MRPTALGRTGAFRRPTFRAAASDFAQFRASGQQKPQEKRTAQQGRENSHRQFSGGHQYSRRRVANHQERPAEQPRREKQISVVRPDQQPADVRGHHAHEPDRAAGRHAQGDGRAAAEPILGRTTAVGPLMRRHLAPVLQPLLRGLQQLQEAA